MKRFALVALISTVLGLATACGGSSATCCLSGTAYTCSSATAATQCVQNGDTSGCSRDPANDAPSGSMTCKN